MENLLKDLEKLIDLGYDTNEAIELLKVMELRKIHVELWNYRRGIRL